jgi:hypothetical protein
MFKMILFSLCLPTYFLQFRNFLWSPHHKFWSLLTEPELYACSVWIVTKWILPPGQTFARVIDLLCVLCYGFLPPSPCSLRKAKENLFRQSRSFSNGHVVCEKKQQLELDSVAEEIMTGDYALVINGHSLVSSLQALVLSFTLPQ